MINAYERRRNRRLPIELKLEVNKLFKQDNEVLSDINADIEVYDISRTGIGFTSRAELPMGYYFDCMIKLSGDDFFRTVIKIVRVNKTDDAKTGYGAEFVGLAQFLAAKIDDYGKKLSGDDAMSYNF